MIFFLIFDKKNLKPNIFFLPYQVPLVSSTDVQNGGWNDRLATSPQYYSSKGSPNPNGGSTPGSPPIQDIQVRNFSYIYCL